MRRAAAALRPSVACVRVAPRVRAITSVPGSRAITAPHVNPSDAAACLNPNEARHVLTWLLLLTSRASLAATAADNYRCPSCKWFWSFEVRTPAAPSC